MHNTFLCAHTHRSHQSQIQHAKCVRPTFFNHCKRERAHAHTPCIFQRESARTPCILQERRRCTKHSYAHTAAFPGIQGIHSLLRFRYFLLWRFERCVPFFNLFNHCCVSGYSGIQSLLRFRVFRVFNHCCVSGYSGYSITAAFPGIQVFNHCCVSGYFGCEGLNGMCPSSISSITAAFPVQLRRSRAYAKCQCMDLLLAQRSMSRRKQVCTSTLTFLLLLVYSVSIWYAA